MGTFESFSFGSELERRRADEFLESLEELPPRRMRSPMFVPEDEPTPPAGLPIAEHFQWASRCEEGRWVESDSRSKVKASDLNPGFVNAAGELLFDSRLDNSLIDLMVREHSAFLTAESLRRRWPHEGDRIKVAIVDMSKGNLCRPRYAGWGSEHLFQAGSTAKVALLYAAHQLIADLNVLAHRDGITDLTALERRANAHWGTAIPQKPAVAKLAKFDGTRVRPSQHLRETVEKMIKREHSNVSTGMANVVLHDIGFDYVGSLLWQSGLRHPTKKGLWFPNDFGPTRRWARDPFREGRIGLTARSVATFHTLLAQRRLVNAGNSEKMEAILRGGCQFFMPSAATVRATKCGLVPDQVRHNSALLSAAGDLLYVVVCLTKGKDAETADALEKLMRGIHALIVRRNA